MYGADWPVFNLGKDCGIVNAFEIIDRIVSEHSNGDTQVWDDIFQYNAINIYKLSV